MRRNRIGVAVFIVGALLSAVWAFSKLQPLIDMFGQGAGGFGVVGGNVDTLQYVVAPLIAFALSRRLRGRVGFPRSLRRAHAITTVATVTLAALMAVVIVIGRTPDGWEPALFIAVMLGAALWLPLQGFFAAGFLGLLIRERRSVA